MTYSISNIHKKPEAVLLLLSVFLAGAWAFLVPLNFYPDSEQYIKTSLAILGKNSGDIYYYRTWGYPIVLILSGVLILNSFKIVLFVQAICSVLMTIFIYLAILPFGRRTAFLTSIISLISLATVIWQNVIMTDQVSMLLIYVLVFAAVRFVNSKSTESNFIIVFSGFFLYTLRPAAILTYGLVVIVILLFEIRAWRKIISGAGIFAMLVFSFQSAQNLRTDWFFERHQKDPTFSKGSMAGRMFFFNVFAVGPQLVGDKTVTVNNGAGTEELFETLSTWAKNNPQGMINYSKTFGPKIEVHDPKEFAGLLFQYPDLYTHSIMWLALDQTIGARRADLLFAKAAFEGLRAKPKILMLYYQGIIEFFLMGDVVYNTGQRVTWDENSISTALTSTYLSTDVSFPKNLNHELEEKQLFFQNHASIMKSFMGFAFYWQTAIKIAAVFVSSLTLLFCFLWNRQSAFFAVLCVVLLLYQACTATVFAAPHFRYISPVVPLTIMLACVSFTACRRFFSQSREQRRSIIQGH